MKRIILLAVSWCGFAISGDDLALGATFENSSHQMAAGNFDVDGANELVYIRAVNNWAAAGGPTAGNIFIRDFNGGLSRAALPGVTATQVVAADINGDGRDEVVFIDGTTGFLRSYNFASSTFSTHTNFAIQDVTAGQIDGDAQIELLMADAGATPTMRNYDAVTTVLSAAAPGGSAGNNVAGNFNGDALTDFALRSGVNYGSGALFTAINPYAANTSLGGGLNRIATGNLDASDATDEIFLTNSANNIYVHPVNAGSFTQTVAGSAGTDPTVGHPETFGDGRDLGYVIGGGIIYQGTTTWNIASGPTMTFTQLRQTASVDGSANVTGNADHFDFIAADVTGDGLDEILGRKNADTGASISFFQNGAASFVQQNALVTLTASDTAGTSSFVTAGNWSNAAAPSLLNNYDVDSSRTLRTTLDVGGQTFGGASLTIQAGSTLSLNHSGTDTIDNFILNGGTLLQGGNTANTTMTLAGNVSLTADSNVDTAGRNLNLSAVVNGPAKLTKIGAGTLTLSAPSQLFGDLAVNAGTVELSNSSTTVDDLTGTGTVQLTGASTLTVGGLNNTNSGNFSGDIQGGGGLTKTGTGTQTLSGTVSNGFTGTTLVDNGTLVLSKTGGAVAITGPVTMGAGNTNQPNLRMGGNDQFAPGVVATFANASGNWTRMDLLGTTQTLAGIQSGTVATQGSGVIQNGGVGVGAAGTATLTLNGSGNYVYNGYVRNQDNVASGALLLVKNGTGTQTLAGSVITYTGSTTVNSGTLALRDTTSFASATTVNGGTLSLQDTIAGTATTGVPSLLINGGGTVETIRSVTGIANRKVMMGNAITGSGIININNANNTVGNADGGWTTVNGGTGSLNFSGTINVNSGVFARDSTNVTTINGTATVNVAAGAVFGAGRGGNSTIGALNGAGTVSTVWLNASAGSITIGNGDGGGNFSGSIRGNGTGAVDGNIEGGVMSVIKTGAGTQILSGTNTYSGTTTINGGKLQIGDGGSTGTLGTGAVTITSPGNLTFNRNNAYAPANAISGNGSLTQDGTGSTTLSGATITYSGATTVNAGSLVLSNTTSFASTTTTVNGGTLSLQDSVAGTATTGVPALLINSGGTVETIRSVTGIANRKVMMGNAITGSGIININNAANTAGTADGGWTTVNGGTGSLNFSGTINVNSGVFARDNVNVSTINGTATVNVAAGAVFGAGRGGNSTIGGLNGAGIVSTVWASPNAGSITIGNGGGNGNFTGTIRGNGGVTDGTVDGGIMSVIKTGLGTQTFTGINTYSGATTINQGTLVLQNNTAGAGAHDAVVSPVTVNAAGTLTLNQTQNGVANRTDLSGNITGTGVININNATPGAAGGWVTVNHTNTGRVLNFDGTINVNSGVLTRDFLAANTIQGTATVNIAAGGVLGTRGGSVIVGSLNDGPSNAGDVSPVWSGASATTLTVGNGDKSGAFSGIIHGNGTSAVDGNIEGGIISLIKTGTGTQTLTGASTYSGTTTIQNGTLSINTIKNLSTTSAIGAPTTAANGLIRMGNAATNGTLRYTGMGDSSNRTIQVGVGSTAGDTGGATIQNDGSGAIGFTAATFNTAETGGTPARTLTLQGSYAGTSTIAGVIQDNIPGVKAVGVTKSGAGTWSLNGVNTYTGNTSIASGTLQIGGAGQLGSGVYSGAISNNATLQYSSSANQVLAGAISGTGTILKDGSGNLLLSAVGSIAPTQNITVSAGTLTIQPDAGGRTLSNNIVLSGGTLLGMQDNIGSGGLITVGANVTHTFNASGTLALPSAVTADALLVGGGGGASGGTNAVVYGIGGGGGQVLNQSGVLLASGSSAVTVGAGGAGSLQVLAGSGGASSIAALTAVGGAGGPALGLGGTSGSGNAGGASNGVAAGGGGGNGAVGQNAPSTTVGGAGGAGSIGTLTGITYGGGGGGAAGTTGGAGGAGGGGTANAAGVPSAGIHGVANTGGGGAGGNSGSAGGTGGTGLVVVRYPYAQSAGTVTLSGTIDVQNASTLDAYGAGGTMIESGPMTTTTGPGGINIASSNNAGGVVRYDSVAKTYAGNTTIGGGATLRMNLTNAMPNGSGKGNVVLNGGATAGTFDLNDFDTAINGLDGTTGAVLGQVVNNGSASARTLTVGNGNANGTFAGIIRDNTSGTGSVALTKTGLGTQSLTGANTFTGVTTVQGGTLQLDGGGKITNTASVTVGNAAGNGRLLVTTNAAHQLGAGEVVLGSTAGSTGTFDMQATTGTVSVVNNLVVGDAGVGNVNHTSGALDIGNGNATDAIGDLLLGRNAGAASSTYAISGGSVIADNIYVGESGGTAGSPHVLTVNPGATVTARRDLRVGAGGFGRVNQTGGTVNVNGVPTAIIGDGSTGTYDLTGGGLLAIAGNAEVGTNGGNGTMNHTQGTVTVGQDLTVGDVGSTGTYTMANDAANSLTVAGNEFIGVGTGVGTFTQNGGTHTLNGAGANGNLTVGASGQFNLAGGTLDFRDYAAGGTAWNPAHTSEINLTSGNQFVFTGGTLQDVSTINVGDALPFTQSGGNFVVGQDGIGPAAQTTINGGYSLLGGVLRLDVFGDDLTPEECCDGVPGNNDQLTVAGEALLDSAVSLNYVGSFEPEFGDVFTLICAEEITLEDGFFIDGGFFRLVPTGNGDFPFALQAIVPEPASLAVWTLVGIAGAAATLRCRRGRKVNGAK